MGALIQMQGISKSYGPVHALEEVDLTVGEREIIGLLGDNGASRIYGPQKGLTATDIRAVEAAFERVAACCGARGDHEAGRAHPFRNAESVVPDVPDHGLFPYAVGYCSIYP